MKSKNDDISVSIPTSAECKQVPEENVKKKRMMRADIKVFLREFLLHIILLYDCSYQGIACQLLSHQIQTMRISF